MTLESIAVRLKIGDYYRSKESMLADLELMVSGSEKVSESRRKR